MKALRYVRLLAFIPFCLLIFLIGLWYLVLTEALLTRILHNSLIKLPVPLAAGKISKTGFYSVSLKYLKIGKSGQELVFINSVSANLDLVSLARFALRFPVKASLDEGWLEGWVEWSAGGCHGRLVLSNAGLNSIYCVQSLLGADGTINGNLDFDAEAIKARLHITGDHLCQPMIRKILPLPSRFNFATIQTDLLLQKDSIKVNSMNLEGERIYARAKGTIIDRKFSGSLEVMPEAALVMSSPLLWNYLEPYKTSPLHFTIPLQSIPVN